HGTHVAGIIAGAGNNGKGIAGVCWSAQIMAVRVLDASGSGSTADIVQGLNFAVQNGAKVVNMSLGGSVFDSAFSTAITNARTAGVAIVVAAGNDGSNLNSANTYPCEYSQDNVLCVAALDQSYSLATFSNYDTTSVALNNVDVGAPGTNILSSFAGVTTTVNDTFNTSGTLNWSTTGSGWGYSACNLGQVVDVIGNPTTWCSLGQYANNANDTIYKTFNVPSGADMVSVAYGLFLDVASGDTFSVHYKSGSGEPFSSGTQLASYTNVSTGGSPVFLGHELKNCAGQSQCSVGYRLVTNASGTTYGPGILLFSLIGMDVDATTQYKVEDGTSMASPAAAGVVALVLSYNPSYTYLDALNAVLNSGNAQTALNGKSKTGKSVDANNAIRYVAPPTGISLTAQ
ncbi:MAG TPA: S8 family serine peptidase, partial [Leptospiraceae bacterium]|nr:S8 family serine peptidase [Leptospiraceae bacterium]